MSVSETSALRLVVVYACLRVLSESLASLPFVLYRRGPNGARERATDHPLYRILHDRPNPELSSFHFREMLEAHRLSYGNAFAEIEWGNDGHVRALWPLLPDRTCVHRAGDGRRVVVTEAGGQRYTLPAERVLHVAGLGFDGLMGYSPIRMAASAIGIGLAAEEYSGRWFGSGARPSMLLSHPAQLTPAGAARIRASMEGQLSGLSQAHRIAVLEEGMKAEPWGVPADEAQFLETQKFAAEQIARLYRLPPHKVGLLDRATNNNIEHQDIEFVRDSMLPNARRWEQPVAHALLTERDRGEYFAEFLFDGLLRGDSETRHKVYAAGRQWGYFSANDVRQMENLNPIEGGDIYMMPVNMIPAEQAGLSLLGGDDAEADDGGAGGKALRSATVVSPPEERQRRSAASRQRLRRVYEQLFVAASERFVRRESKRALYLLKKAIDGDRLDFAAFMREMDAFYAEFPSTVRRELLPVLVAFAEVLRAELATELDMDESDLPAATFATEYAERYGREYVTSSRNQLAALARETEAAELAGALEQRLTEWGETRATKTAGSESVRFGGAFALAVYGFVGLAAVRWSATGESCPLCSRLHGRVTAVKGHFLRDGDVVDPEDGKTTPLTVKHYIRHPPLHGGCDCTITSA